MEVEKIYFSTHEVVRETGLPMHTLRYWEKRFEQLSPRKDGHGNRYYTADDIRLIKRLKYLRDDMKITRIEAMQKELAEGTRHSDARQRATEILQRVRAELVEIRKFLR